jgi:hypothetical protein
MRIRIIVMKVTVLAAMLWLAGVPSGGAPQQSIPAAAVADTAQGTEARYPVAHVHFGGVCKGYLYIGPNSVRYAVVRPDKDKNHSFQISRLELAGVEPWILLGKPQNITEFRTSRAIYHFWLLPNDADVNSGGLFNGNAAAPAATLIAAIQNPAPPAPRSAPETAGATAASAVSDATFNHDTTRPLPSGALDGIYVGIDIPFQRIRRLNFSPDGWVVKDIPQESMIGFDFTAYRNDRNTNRSWVGRYQVDGDKINIEWQDFRGPGYPPSREVVERNEVSAHPTSAVGSDTFIPMCRCTGKRFSGTYIWGRTAAGQYLQFFPDGTFIDHSVTDQLIVPSRFYDHPRIQQGTYSIQSQTMIFTFADGHRGTRTFIAPKAQENDPMLDWIGLGWQQLYEQNYEMRLRQGR